MRGRKEGVAQIGAGYNWSYNFQLVISISLFGKVCLGTFLLRGNPVRIISLDTLTCISKLIMFSLQQPKLNLTQCPQVVRSPRVLDQSHQQINWHEPNLSSPSWMTQINTLTHPYSSTVDSGQVSPCLRTWPNALLTDSYSSNWRKSNPIQVPNYCHRCYNSHSPIWLGIPISPNFQDLFSDSYSPT